MKIKIACVGKIKERFYSEAIKEYSKRLAAYANLEIVEVADEKTPDKASEAINRQIKEKEGSRLLAKIKEQEYVILLDLRGQMYSSEEMSQQLSQAMLSGKSDFTFVIGGSLGVSEAVKQRANEVWCFSKMTFPHQLMRVILLEQIYRAFKIMYHEPYHK